MKVLSLVLLLIPTIVSADETLNDFYLKQVDYRRRLSFSVAIPEIARLRLRPSLEFRYRTQKKNLIKCTKRGDCPSKEDLLD